MRMVTLFILSSMVLSLSLIHISEYYIRDSAVKLGFYQRIQQAQAISRLHLLADEMIDRFGDIPPETWNLLRAAELKIYCTEIGIRSLKQKGGIVSARFEPDTKMDLPKLQELIKKYKRQLTYGLSLIHI